MHYFKNNVTINILSDFGSSLSPEGSFSNEKIEQLSHLFLFILACSGIFFFSSSLFHKFSFGMF